MKYFVALIVLIGCGLYYVRAQQPVMWNQGIVATSQFLISLKVSKISAVAVSPSGDTNAVPAVTTASGDDSQENPPANAEPASSTTPEIISPNSTAHINPDHVRPVLQPGETAPPEPTNGPAATAPATTMPDTNVPATTTPPATNAPDTNSPATNAPATNASATRLTPTKMAGARTSIPKTITTLSGKTYTGCSLSGVTPDGISFLDSVGGAKVKFSDLDPSFGSVFGYDPVAAQQYDEQQAELAKQIDADQAAAKAAQAALLSADSASPAASGPTAPESEPGASAPVSAPAPAPMSDTDKAAIQAQITTLDSDIAFMQGEEDKLSNQRTLKADGGEVTNGAYPERIAEEQAKIGELQKLLSQ